MQLLSFLTIHCQGFFGHMKEQWYRRSIEMAQTMFLNNWTVAGAGTRRFGSPIWELRINCKFQLNRDDALAINRVVD
ncbi:unnamed protein product [Urochloa humidicola]